MPMALSGNSSVLIPVDAEKKTTNPIVVIDNYDSFTYNLCQYMGELGCNFEVYRNDELTVDELKKKIQGECLYHRDQVHLKIQEYHYKLYWNLDPLYPCLVSVWDYNALGRLLEGR